MGRRGSNSRLPESESGGLPTDLLPSAHLSMPSGESASLPAATSVAARGTEPSSTFSLRGCGAFVKRCGRWDSNPRSLVPETSALSARPPPRSRLRRLVDTIEPVVHAGTAYGSYSVRLAGLEPATLDLGNPYSIRLSYRRGPGSETRPSPSLGSLARNRTGTPEGTGT